MSQEQSENNESSLLNELNNALRNSIKSLNEIRNQVNFEATDENNLNLTIDDIKIVETKLKELSNQINEYNNLDFQEECLTSLFSNSTLSLFRLLIVLFITSI